MVMLSGLARRQNADRESTTILADPAGRSGLVVPPQLRVKEALVVRLLEQREPGGVMRHVVGASDRFGHVDQARGREHAAVPTRTRFLQRDSKRSQSENA